MPKRSVLLGITIGLAALLLIYTFLRTFTSIKFDETSERYVISGILAAALGIFVMSRRLAAEETKEAETKELEDSVETDKSEEA